ncbi:MAG: BTAD domain-containing putative transcriptional regulator [Anaerolineales bacterium]
MTTLQTFVQDGYEALLHYSRDVDVTLLHPHSRYRSMIVARLFEQKPKQVFYYAMGPQDVNLSAFLFGFVHDMLEQQPQFGQHINQYSNRFDEIAFDELLEAFLADLAELSEQAFFLVLDEYDVSEHAQDVQSFLQQVLLHLPEHCRVIINSRSLPRLPWVALIARRKAAILSDSRLVDHDPYQIEQTEHAIANLHVQCLGPGNIWKDDVRIESWEGHLPRLLLIFALERPVVTRSEICRAFWPNLDNDQAVNVFHVTKRRLHKALGFDALVHQNGYYQINPEANVTYDVMNFVGSLVHGRHAESSGDALAAWEQALDIYSGPFLQGHAEDWIREQREAYQAGYLEAAMALANARLQNGRHEQALRLLIHAGQENGDYEPIHQEIMKLYAQLGRRSEVASHYQTLAENMQERGLKPSEETHQLYNELMA